MSSAVVAAGASSSCSAAFTRNHSIKTTTPPLPTPHSQRTSFQGLSIQDAKKGLFNSFIASVLLSYPPSCARSRRWPRFLPLPHSLSVSLSRNPPTRKVGFPIMNRDTVLRLGHRRLGSSWGIYKFLMMPHASSTDNGKSLNHSNICHNVNNVFILRSTMYFAGTVFAYGVTSSGKTHTMHQAGPGYLDVATRMHFQRTASLEQEIESLKKKLTACTREKLNLQEELSEAYRIKGQLADLHAAEVSKENSEWNDWQTTVLQERNIVENVYRWACGRPTALQDRTRDSDEDNLKISSNLRKNMTVRNLLLFYVVVATDDEKIAECCRGFGADVIMTSESCRNGTERCNEALQKLKEKYDVVVNIQGDEPLIDPEVIDGIVKALQVPYITTALMDAKLGTEGRKDLFDWLSRQLSGLSNFPDAVNLNYVLFQFVMLDGCDL
ncbi:hypothetical protein TEA_008418 [Camellia sinensis var. sinensis]|uniref:Kinesin motor domain-containing protein n=1 Tax=Camellia sinensis var. sinensis TaxID=542762 RepID=A0A4S4DNU3_CAMSN|nr:hypothetical protein TEA_008418 [Camellia sinensis var. sinensis]